jgi:outer membrane immunogenic protein
LTISRHLIGWAFAVAAIAAPAHAQDSSRPTFEGPRVEGIVGNDSHFFYGGAIGYDMQRGKVVLGFEGEIDLSNWRQCETLDPTINDRLCVKRKGDIYVGGRIGIAVAPSTLIYGKLGYTSLRERVAYDGGTGGGSVRYVDQRDGFRVGAGIEHKLGANLYVKGEYRYSNYERGGWKHDGVVGLGFRF